MKKPVVLFIAVACSAISYFTIFQQSRGNELGNEEQFKENTEEEKEAGIDKEMTAWFQSRGYPDPYFLNDKYARAWEQALKLKQIKPGYNNRIENNSNWTSLGPDNGIGGRILSIAINPVKSTSIYLGSPSGGIWKSYNGGSNWQSVSTNTQVLGVSSIIINPADTMVIYAGTGEVYRIDSTAGAPNPGNTGYNVWKTRGTYGVGILKSRDGGNTWSKVLNKSIANLFGIQRLRFNPINPKTVYACATDGLYRTLDSGANWNKILNLTYLTDVVINAKDTNQIVAAAGNLGNTAKGIWRSTNGGISWTKIASGLPASFQGFIKFDNVTSLGNRDTILASIGVSESAGVNEIYRSTDFGNTWAVKTSSTHTQWQYWSAHSVAINPSNTDKLIFGGVKTYNYTISTSTKGGALSIHDDIHDVQFDPSNSNNVYIAGDGGMYKSTNGGTSFSLINTGLAATQFYATIGVSATDANLIIGGLQDNFVWMTTNGGSTWSQFPNANADGAACAVDPSNDNIIMASIDARGFYRSGNRGSTSSNVLSYLGGPHDSRTAFVAPIAISNKKPSVVYVGTDNLHKSINSGSTWTNNVGYVGNTTPSAFIEAVHKTAIAIEVSPTDPNGDTLFISTSPFAQFDNDADGLFVTGQPNILKSTNGGATLPMASVKGTLPDRFVMDFAMSPTNHDSMFIALGGFGTAHIYVTANGGTSWTALGGALPDVPFNALVFDPVNPKIIYAGCDLGVYVSGDRGLTWVDFNTGFWDATQVVDLKITANNKLLAATHGKGIFISDLYNNITLPATLLDFNGSGYSGYNQLQWKVSQEQNLSRYELERSADGSVYTKVAAIPSLNQTSVTTYTHQDNTFLFETYYRLKLVDIDGRFTYSSVVFIRKTNVKNEFNVLGNPFSNEIVLKCKLSNNQKVNVQLFNTTGSLIRKEEYAATAGTGIYTISGFQALNSGIYLLKIESGGDRQTIRLMKN